MRHFLPHCRITAKVELAKIKPMEPAMDSGAMPFVKVKG
jgi:hypothetical protein